MVKQRQKNAPGLILLAKLEDEAFLSEKPTQLQEILHVIRLSSIGSHWVDRFLHLQAEGKIFVDHIQDAEGVSISFADGLSGLSFDGETVGIYLDFERPLGVLALALVHELALVMHPEFFPSMETNQALKEKFRKRGQKIINEVMERSGKIYRHLHDEDFTQPELHHLIRQHQTSHLYEQRWIFRARKSAFETQYHVFCELKRQLKGYEELLVNEETFEFLLEGQLSDQDILYLCQLDRKVFEKKLKAS